MSTRKNPKIVNTPEQKREKSPLSPSRKTRIQEKEELQSLNNRLAAYIDKIRQVENQNNVLYQQLEVLEEQSKNERTTVKCMYDREISDLRNLLDDISKKNAELKLSNDKIMDLSKDEAKKSAEAKNELEHFRKKYDFLLIDYDQMKPKMKECLASVSKLQLEMNKLSDENAQLNAEISRLNKKLAPLSNENRNLSESVKKLKLSLNEAENQLKTAKDQLEDETLKRVDLENRIQTLKEDIDFKKSMYNEIIEAQSRHEIIVKEVEPEIRIEYEGKLEAEIEEMRRNNEWQTENLREEIAHFYDKKINSLEKDLQDSRDMTNMYRDEAYKYKVEVESTSDGHADLEKQINSLRNEISQLKNLNRGLSEKLSHEKDHFIDMINKRDNEIRSLQDQLTDYIKDYQELESVKIALDQELSIYSNLLSLEEARVNARSSKSATSSPVNIKSSFSKLNKTEDVRNFSSVGSASKRSKRIDNEVPPVHKRFASVKDDKSEKVEMLSGSTQSNKRKIAKPNIFSSSYSAAKDDDDSLKEGFKYGGSGAQSISQAYGGIQISESDPEGKYVQLTNETNRDVCLGGWMISRTTGTSESNIVTYTIGRRLTIPAGESIIFYSMSNKKHVTHNPSQKHVIMKDVEWPVGETYVTTLFNSDGEEMATHQVASHQESCRKVYARSSSHLTSPDSGYLSSSRQSLSRHNKDEKDCVIM